MGLGPSTGCTLREALGCIGVVLPASRTGNVRRDARTEQHCSRNGQSVQLALSYDDQTPDLAVGWVSPHLTCCLEYGIIQIDRVGPSESLAHHRGDGGPLRPQGCTRPFLSGLSEPLTAPLPSASCLLRPAALSLG